MFCRNCGKEINDHDKFCIYCGQKTQVDSDVQYSSLFYNHMDKATMSEKSLQNQQDKKKFKIIAGIIVACIFCMIVSLVDPDTGAESNDGKQNARITDFQDDVSTEEYINVSLEDLARRYKDYLGENICVTGIAVDMVGNINISNMDGIYICINGDFDIKPLSGDTITVYGKVVEDDFFKNTPAIDAVKVDIFY